MDGASYVLSIPLLPKKETESKFYIYTDETHTHTLSHTKAFTPSGFYIQTFLHSDALTHGRFDTQTLLHTDTLTHRDFYTQKLLHTDVFTHRHKKRKTHTRTHTQAQTHMHTKRRTLTHRHTQTHTDTHTAKSSLSWPPQQSLYGLTCVHSLYQQRRSQRDTAEMDSCHVQRCGRRRRVELPPEWFNQQKNV